MSTAVGALVAAVAARGVPQAVVSFDAWSPASAKVGRTSYGDVGGVPVMRVEEVLDDRALASFLAEQRPDVVQVHDSMLSMVVHLDGLTPRPPRVQMVHVLSHLQDALRGAAEPTGTTVTLDNAASYADRIVVATHAARAAAVDRWPALADRIRVAGLAPSLPSLARAADAQAGPIVAALRFDWLKGADLLVEALPALTALRPVVIAGGMPEAPRTERRWAAKLRAAGATLTGWLAPEALAELLSRTALFVAPSRLETCGLSLLEAAAAGVPCVASDVAAHREGVPSATTFASGDARALAEAVRVALSEPRAPARPPGWDARVPEWLAFWSECR